jgi:beta-glucosidase
MIRTRALNILRLMQRTGALYDTHPFKEQADDRPEHRALIRRAGAEGTVLLKNDGLLPLDANGSVAVIGPNAKTAQIMGGGSAQLNPHYSVSPYQGIVSKLGEASVSYATGCTNHRWEPMLSGEFDIAFFDNTMLSGTPVHTGTQQDAMGFFVPPIAEGKVRPDHFSARMTKTITPEVSGTYQLGAHGAAYLRVFVDGKLIVDLSEQNWTKGRTFFEEGCDHLTGEVTLTAGQDHKI